MLSKLLTAGWLIGVPTALLVISAWDIAASLRVDTRRETADQIRRGMTREEVARIVGGPNGDYRVWARSRPQFISGNTWPTIYVWESYHGRIEVKDGEHGIRSDPATGELQSWSRSGGAVEWVIWKPVPEEERGWHPLVAIGYLAALYFGAAGALYGWWYFLSRPGSVKGSAAGVGRPESRPEPRPLA